MDADELFAHVNDAIRKLATEGQEKETWEFLCECPDPACHTLVTLTLIEFDERRAASLPLCANHDDDYAPVDGVEQQVSVASIDGTASGNGS